MTAPPEDEAQQQPPPAERHPSTGHDCPRPGLRSLHHRFIPDAESLEQAAAQVGHLLSFRPLAAETDCQQFAGHLNLNGMPLLSYSGSAVQMVVEPAATVSLLACFTGQGHVGDQLGEAHCWAQGCLLLPIGTGPRHYSSSPGGASAAVLNLEPAAISRAAAAIAGSTHQPDQIPGGFSLFALRALTPAQAKPLHSLLRHIDHCASVDPALPGRLGLDDVIVRLMASWLQPSLLTEPATDGQHLREHSTRSAFDALIDFIRANLDQPLRLSDLEARSNYSRRALQYAFREKLNASPKQWIREQRLALAMERLQSPGPHKSIHATALACGYRSMSQFSADFKRRYGLSPSEVRRPRLN